MQKVLFIILLLLTYTRACCQDASFIYQDVLTSYASGLKQPGITTTPKFLITKKPIYSSPGEYVYLSDAYKQLSIDTFNDFIKFYGSNVNENDFLFDNIECIFIDSLPDLRQREIYSAYRGTNGCIFEFSTIGFNQSKTQALVYYGFRQGAYTGAGLYFVYEKKRYKWKRKKSIPAWST